MNLSITANESVKLTVAAAKADKTASQAKLSNITFTSSDPTIFTIAPDPAVPNGAILIALKAGTATNTYKATATETDNVTVETISGVDTIVVAAAPMPAVALVATYGTPFITAPPPPPPPPVL